jgi:hypothetical protein
MGLTKEQVMIEYVKCLQDTPYALRTYLQTYDNTVSKYVPLELFTDQISLLKDYEDYEENIALKYRQAGVSTVTAAWISKRLVFAKKTQPEKILIIANKLDTSVEMANKIRAFIDQWPNWVGAGFASEKNSQRHYKLTNGSEVKAVATSKDALRGFTPTILVFDEAAFIEADSDFWAACMASLSTGGKVIVISTPNGYDPIYYEIYDQALKGMNQFKISEMFWYRDPRYAKDLYLVPTEDLIHYLLNKEEYDESKNISWAHIDPYERDYDELELFFKQGYKPCSTWYEKMVKKLKYDKRKINQELNCEFLGSGDNVFDNKQLEDIKDNYLMDPPSKLMGNSLWLWKEPIEGHKYIMGVDVSRGDSEDFSTIQIIDFNEREQVLEYIGKIPPDTLAEVAYKWGMMYNAFVVVDITGGMGITTVRKMQELGYKNLYVEGVDPLNIWSTNKGNVEKIPGLNFNNKRVQIIAAFEEAVRHKFKIRSVRLYNEMNTFVYINGRPDHQKGQHDDLIMGISMPIYISEASFSKLERATEQAKSMIDSWAVVNNDTIKQQTHFDPLIPNQNVLHERNGLNNNGASKNDYIEYNWLFGGIKK